MNAFASKLIITESVIRISIKNEKEAGNHQISNKRIQEDEKYGVSLRPHAVQEWSLKLIKGITKRRYEMCHSAVEVYFIDKTSIMLDFEKNVNRKKFFQFIKTANTPNYQNRSSSVSFMRTRLNKAAEKWAAREITNFEYLMVLNDCAGRTYHDLAQYPVFPWVLSNYTSEQLDLSLISNFRDLSKPVGAQSEEAAQNYTKKYEQTKEMYEATKNADGKANKIDGMVLNGFPRHYATHYSSPHSVIWYLTRIEPFASMAIDLHGGSFDKTGSTIFQRGKMLEQCRILAL